MTGRQGIEIDYCQHCRGVWLDRGELDKPVERSGRPADLQPAKDHDDYRDQESHRQHYGRRKSWLGSIVD